jgi:NADH-quinone oxidoreductase subunit L
VVYIQKKAVPVEDPQQKGFTRLSAHKFYIDEIYDYLVVKPLESISLFAHNIVDRYIIDGVVNLSARVVSALSGILKHLQSGNVEYYLAAMVAGIILILIFNTLK